MPAPQETDQRLRSWLDTNQLGRERLCQAILALDERFTLVRLRHPRGGPDGGRDLEAQFFDGRRVFGAIGFQNSISDSQTERSAASRKFNADLEAALTADSGLNVFVFFTNVSLTLGDKRALEAVANEKGIQVLDIFDRERMRIVLDSTNGLAVRFQYLNLKMSDAEQAAFFARWGDRIENVITNSSDAVHMKLNRLEFNQEQSRALHHLSFHFKLSRRLSETEIPHHRALMIIKFAPLNNGPLGTLHIMDCDDHGEWEQQGGAGLPGYGRLVTTCWGREPTHLLQQGLYCGNNPFENVTASFKTSIFGPAILGKKLAGLDDAIISFFANKILAEAVKEITVIANQYIIWNTPSEPTVELNDPDARFPVAFTSTELADRWVELKPPLTMGWIDFTRYTPQRMLAAEQIRRSWG
jgi:hypothetical protein